MKKLLITIIASIAALNAFAVTYDFSSEEKLEASFAAQAKVEEVEAADAQELLEVYVTVLAMQNAEAFEALGDNEDAVLSLALGLLEKQIQGKTLVEIASQLDTMTDELEAILEKVE